ncbi:MAG: hypothetical protein WBA25_12935 [Jannaschia sp.]
MTPQHGATGRREQEPSTPSIENAFAQIKAHLRKAAERTVAGLWGRIAEVIDIVTPHHARNDFNAAGYAPN